MTKNIRRMIISAVIVVVLLIVVIPRALAASGDVTTPTTFPISDDVMRQQVADGINKVRADNGLRPLSLNDSLTSESQKWASHLSSDYNFGISHNPLLSDAIAAAGFSSGGEIVAQSSVIGSGQVPVDLWIKSPGHFKVMTGSDYTHMGIGFRASIYHSAVLNTDFTYGYWVVEFGGGTVNTPAPTPTNSPVTQAPNTGFQTYGNFQLGGPVLSAYRSLGADTGFLGLPSSPQFSGLKNGGYGQHFAGGSLYGSPSTGVQPIGGAFRDLYASKGWETSYLGYPTSGEIPVRGGVIQRFQGGLMYWSAATGAHDVQGDILAKYGSYGWEGGRMGFPTTNQVGLRNGAFTAFQGGSIYWSRTTGAHAVFGAIRDTWGSVGWENGFGYPTSDEFGPLRGGGYGQHFQGGSIYWSPASGGHTVSGAFRNLYAAQGWENGRLGYPTSQEYKAGKEIRQNFQGGVLIWNGKTARIG